jgi:hypothetical protein
VPARSRNALDFRLPPASTRPAPLPALDISGLPQNTINITIDGVSTCNNLQSGTGSSRWSRPA